MTEHAADRGLGDRDLDRGDPAPTIPPVLLASLGVPYPPPGFANG
jgi:hypothetical protein